MCLAATGNESKAAAAEEAKAGTSGGLPPPPHQLLQRVQAVEQLELNVVWVFEAVFKEHGK